MLSSVIIYFYGSDGIRQIDYNIILGWRFNPIMAISLVLNFVNEVAKVGKKGKWLLVIRKRLLANR